MEQDKLAAVGLHVKNTLRASGILNQMLRPHKSEIEENNTLVIAWGRKGANENNEEKLQTLMLPFNSSAEAERGLTVLKVLRYGDAGLGDDVVQTREEHAYAPRQISTGFEMS